MKPVLLIVSLAYLLLNVNGLLCDFKTCKNKIVTDSDITCTDETVCTGSTLDSSTFVDCNGIKSCIRAQSITAADSVTCSTDLSCSSINQGVVSETGDISCSGFKSCVKAPLTTLNGNIYCNGPSSCVEGRTTTIMANGNIECSGKNSCRRANLDSSMDVICNGTKACSRVNSIKAAGNVDCLMDNVCQNSNNNIESTGGDINCVASRSCTNSKLLADGDINCIGIEPCQGADITSTNGDITCSYDIYNRYTRWLSCAFATNILALDGSITCQGTKACYGVTGRVYAKRSITVGYASAQEATLESDGDIYCSSMNSCQKSTLTAGNSIYFTAQWACKEGVTATAANVIGCGVNPPSSSSVNPLSTDYKLFSDTDLFDFDDDGIIVADSFKGDCQEGTFYADKALMASAYTIWIYANYIQQAYCWNCRYYSKNGNDLTVDFTGYASGDVRWSSSEPKSVYIHCQDIICTIDCIAGSVAEGGCKTVVIYYTSTSSITINPAACHQNTQYAKKVDGDTVYCPTYVLQDSATVNEIKAFTVINTINGTLNSDTFLDQYSLIVIGIICVMILGFIGYKYYKKQVKESNEYEFDDE